MDLPYFKFKPSQWENGSIQICTRADKGLFLDLCSMYWSRKGDLPFKLAVQKLCLGNASAFDSLIKEEVFRVIDGNVDIDFLNEQLSDYENIKNQNSANAKKGWEKRRALKNSVKTPPVDDDVLRDFDSLKQSYLSDKDVVNAVIKNKKNGFKNLDDLTKKMDLFISELKQRGTLMYDNKEFRSHFRAYWAKKAKQTVVTNNIVY